MTKSRAVTDAQKEARRADILKVALHRFTLTPYESLSMADTADEVGVAKGTLYLYFKSKEEMFLAVYTDQLNDWFEELDRRLKENRDSSINGFVNSVGETLTQRPHLLRLIAILHTVLERNVDYTAAKHFKTWLKARTLATGALLEKHLIFLKPGQGARLLMDINALVIGLQHMAEPSDVMKQVLAEPDMELFRVDLQKHLLEMLKTMLMGLMYEAKYGK